MNMFGCDVISLQRPSFNKETGALSDSDILLRVFNEKTLDLIIDI